jgi:hypothetical protein
MRPNLRWGSCATLSNVSIAIGYSFQEYAGNFTLMSTANISESFGIVRAPKLELSELLKHCRR